MTEEKESRLARTRAKADLAIWEAPDYAQVGDKVRMSKKLLGDRAQDSEGVIHEGVIENILPSGMRVVHFARNIAPGRKHAMMHPVELETVQASKSEGDTKAEGEGTKAREAKPDPKKAKA